MLIQFGSFVPRAYGQKEQGGHQPRPHLSPVPANLSIAGQNEYLEKGVENELPK